MEEKIKLENNTKKENYFLLSLVLYLIVGIGFLFFYRYQLNTDGLSYISIAQKYLFLDLENAINGFWSPFYSWLMVPLLALGLDALLSTKILGLILGIFLFFGVKRLSYQFILSECIRNFIFFAFVPITIYFALSVITPDFLVAIILVYYLSFIFDLGYREDKSRGLMCGFLGGIAYLSKTYALPFFIVHFFLLNLFYYLQSKSIDERKNILFNFFSGFIIFFIISGIWISIISLKYGEFTFGTTGKYNMAVYGPDFKGDPLDYLGLLRPSDEKALSIWDDPTYIELPAWSSFQSVQNLKHLLKTGFENTFKTFFIIYSKFSPISIFIFIIYFLISLEFLRRKIFSREFLYPLITILIYQTGYAFIHIEERYIWIAYILLLFMTGQILIMILQYQFLSETKKKIAAVLLIGSFVIIPLFRLVYRINVGKEFYLISQQLENYKIQGNIASYNKWSESLVIAYYLGNQYYGIPKIGDNKEVIDQLRQYNIDYYLVWDSPEKTPEFLKFHKELTGGKISELRVYSLKNYLE